MFKVMLYKDNKAEDITKVTADLSWSESLDTVGVSLSFSVSDTEERYVPRLLIMAGDIVSLFDDSEELIRGVVINVTRNYPKRTVKVYDFGFYLNKNDIVIQFKNQSVTECLTTLFRKVGVSIGNICDMPAKVNGVYIKNVNEVIKELIKIQQDNDGKKYYYELRGKDIYVFQLPTEPIDYIFKPTTSVAAFDVTDKNAHSRGKYSHSIENMKNRIVAVVNSKKSGEMPEKQFVAEDKENIKRYGLLTENYSVNSDEAENIQSLAENELREKNKVNRELSMDFIGHTKARPGRAMHLVDDYLGIDDNYRIKSVNHKINGCIHTMSCTLENL